MTREEAHKLVDQLFDSETIIEGLESGELKIDVTEETPARVLPEGKRAVRTKNTGDRVYCLDDVAKTRRWITSPEILTGLGFEQTDVAEVEETEMMKYQMGPAIYKLD